MSTPQRYPLEWPVGEPRTPSHQRAWGQFRVSLAVARDHLLHELELLGARDVIISSNVPTRLDGLPHASWSGRVADPGVAVYWTMRKDGKATPFVVACDSYNRVEKNMRAIGKTIEALRAIERHGTRQLRDRAFQGFAQLPAQASPARWRDVLGFSASETVSEDDVDRAFRARAKVCHPDLGGSDSAMAELNAARTAALLEVRRAS